MNLALQAEMDMLLETLHRAGVEIECTDEVQRYLRCYPELMEAVQAMSLAARQKFPDAQLVQTVYQDPEVEDEFLSLFVRRDTYDGSETATIRRIHDEFRSLTQSLSGWFLILTDFQPPQHK